MKTKTCKDCIFYTKSDSKYIARCPDNIKYSNLNNFAVCLYKMQICNDDDKSCETFGDRGFSLLKIRKKLPYL